MKRLTTLLLTTILCLNVQAEDLPKNIDLSGTWQFALDRQHSIKPGDVMTETIQLPGTTDTNKKGDFTAHSEETTHLTRPYSYKGRAWYRREVEIPAKWKKQPVYLFLERTKPTEIYVDGKFAGSSNDISTPQVFDLSKSLTPGRHTLTIMVDNGSGVPEQLYARQQPRLYRGHPDQLERHYWKDRADNGYNACHCRGYTPEFQGFPYQGPAFLCQRSPDFPAGQARCLRMAADGTCGNGCGVVAGVPRYL